MVVFGAGASYDAIDRTVAGNVNAFAGAGYSYLLPLAKDMFAWRENFNAIIGQFPQCQAIIDRMRRHVQVGGQVEQELERLKGDGDSRRPRQLSALRYYLQAAIEECGRVCLQRSAGVTNYVTLLERVEDWRRQAGESVCLVTFNYDQLIDDACRHTLGMETTSLAGYLTEDWILIKLHGSVNWGRKITGPGGFAGSPRDIQRSLIDLGDRLEVAREWEAVCGFSARHPTLLDRPRRPPRGGPRVGSCRWTS